MEWYDPAAVTTAGGHLVITLSQQETHGLDYQGGELNLMMNHFDDDANTFLGLVSSWYESWI